MQTQLRRSSTTRSEAALLAIGQRLFEMQQSLSNTQHLTLSHHNAINDILFSVSEGSSRRTSPNEQQALRPCQMNGSFAWNVVESSTSPDQEDTFATESLPGHRTGPSECPKGKSYVSRYSEQANFSPRIEFFFSSCNYFRGLRILLPRDLY